jgi:hypothetical protein
MTLNQELEKHGFGASSSGGGCEWYTKKMQHKGKNAFIAVTDIGGLALPESMDEPVYVGIYDLDSGDLFEEVQKFESLRSYLGSLADNPED